MARLQDRLDGDWSPIFSLPDQDGNVVDSTGLLRHGRLAVL